LDLQARSYSIFSKKWGGGASWARPVAIGMLLIEFRQAKLGKG